MAESPTNGTALVAFKSGMVANLRNRDGLGGVGVGYYLDEFDEMPVEAVWFEGADTDAEIPTMRSGTKRVDETVTVDLVVQVMLEQGQRFEDAEERGREILVEVQQELAETPAQVVEIQWAELTSWTADPIVLTQPADDGGPPRVLGAASRFDCKVRYRARLEP